MDFKVDFFIKAVIERCKKEKMGRSIVFLITGEFVKRVLCISDGIHLHITVQIIKFKCLPEKL